MWIGLHELHNLLANAVVHFPLALGEFKLNIRHHLGRELRQHFRLQPPQVVRADTLPHLIDAPIAHNRPEVVLHTVASHKQPTWPQKPRHDEIEDAVEFLEPVLHRRSGEAETVAAVQPLRRPGSLGLVILDASALVGHHHIPIPHLDSRIPQQKLVVGNLDARTLSPLNLALLGRPSYYSVGELRIVLLDLRRPDVLDTGRAEDEDIVELGGQRQETESLKRLAQPHIVRQQRTLEPTQSLYEKGYTGPLIRVEEGGRREGKVYVLDVLRGL